MTVESQQFPWQKPGERLQVLVRPHWMVLLAPLVALVFLAILPAVVLAVLSANAVEPFSGLGLAITAVTVPAFYLSLVTWFFIKWIDYYLDVGIVTDQRVIDVDQRGLFRRNIAELEPPMVQDISADKSGILQTLFDFGDVNVQTAGERPNFVFHAVPHPDRVVDEIRESIAASRSKGAVDQNPREAAAEKLHQAATAVEDVAERIDESEAGGTERPGPAGRAADVNQATATAHAGRAGGRTPSQPGTSAPERDGEAGPSPSRPRSPQPPDELPREYER